MMIPDKLHLFHLIFLCFWGGFVLAEFFVELMLRGPEHQNLVAKLHFWMDLFVELPLVLGVLATGLMLLDRLGWFHPLLPLKIVAASLAMIAQLFCILMVAFRYLKRDDPKKLERYQRWIFFSPIVGLPCAILAAWIGFFLRSL